MTLQQLHYIITISESGSLNKASEVLYVSQPSLTSAIRELENELGITIFHRSNKGVTLTNDGTEFVTYARQVYSQYQTLAEKYGETGTLKKKFGVSTQHYSFAVQSFVTMVKQLDATKYEFAIRETRTREVIEDVSTLKSEIGILYLNDFNRAAITKLLTTNQLVFNKLIDCEAYVYVWRGHPLAKSKKVRFEQLAPYPCLAFEQGEGSSFYFAEEILSTNEYSQTIKANDRATVLNLMRGLNGYTLCSGIISEELNGTDYVAIPFVKEKHDTNSKMEVGYIVKKNVILSNVGELYIKEIKEYLSEYVGRV